MAESQSQFGSRNRGLYLTEIEDVVLCRVFVSFGGDEIVENEQKWNAMWKRIEEAYYQLLLNAYKRPINTLQNRWIKINKDVQIFSRILRHCEQAKASGRTDIDVMNEAKKEFRQETGRKWMFRECWEVLKDVPKWSLSNVRINNMHGFVEVVGDGATSSSCTPMSRRENLYMNDNIVELATSISRPPKRRLSITEKQKIRVDPEYEKLDLERKQRLDAANDNFPTFIEIKQKELELKERELAMMIEKNAREEEDRHYYKDTSKFTPAMLAYHQERGNELAESRRARNNARQ